MSDPILSTRHHLLDAYNSLTVAYHKDGPARRNPHLKFARNSIAKALMPDAEGMPYLAGEDWLCAAIEDAIRESSHLGCGTEGQAQFVVEQLFKHLKPEASE